MRRRADPAAMEMAVAALTAWRSPDPGTERIVAALDGPVSPACLIAALLELGSGLISGAEISIDRILATPELLDAARDRLTAGNPIRASEIGCDPSAAMRRAGLAVAARVIT